MGQPTRQGQILMAKESEELRQDRSADRECIQAQMDAYLRQGGLISKVDAAGTVVGFASEAPSNAKPSAKVLPFKARVLAATVHIEPAPVTLKPRPAPTVRAPETVVEWCERVAPAPTAVVIDIVPELRRIRADAVRALARLNAAVERRTA